ncbi:MAG TPA: hypothetical protein EYP98_21095 [Planctomycetes bacterium]|nr:hypothetical protein [Planctomycetota bacterium]
MFDRTTLQYWVARFVLGLLLLLAVGMGVIQRFSPIKDSVGLISLAMGVFGFSISLTAIKPMTRLSTYRSRTRKAWGEDARNAFERASLPRRIFYLLVAVAESDGPIRAAEREVVRQFLLERFDDPVSSDEIRTWETQPLEVQDLIGLAARVAASLSDSELDTLFCWCALVAFADGRFRPDEHHALAEVARGLSLPSGRARMLFHLARAQFLAGSNREGNNQQRPRPHNPHPRGDALSVLGLPINANKDQIRRRHRELVRKFHPDAQPNLGPVAQEEATDRFRAIQHAYELLTDTP